MGDGLAKHRADPQEQACDANADLFLRTEDYPDAIRSHRKFLAHHPRNALAHYHLGFAYGMTGRQKQELEEYQRAASLGLIDWSLFLNLGLAHFEQGDLRSATGMLRLATVLGPNHPETHYNLALMYQRQRMLTEAEQEALVSLTLDPREPDVRNTIALLHAERGDYTRARDEWSELLHDLPDYAPAKANLSLLIRSKKVASTKLPEITGPTTSILVTGSARAFVQGAASRPILSTGP